MKKIRTSSLLFLFFFLLIKGGTAQEAITKKSILKEAIFLTVWREHLSKNSEVINSKEEAIIYENVINDTIKHLGKELVFRTMGDCFQRAVPCYKIIELVHKKNKAIVRFTYHPLWVLSYYDKTTDIRSLIRSTPIKFKLKFKIKRNKLVLKNYDIIDTKFDPKKEGQIGLVKPYHPLVLKE
jgi:hypothetical protein